MAQPENDKLIAFVEKMPAFPKSVQRVLQLTSDLNAPAKEIVRVIECDPIMTIKILKAINSSFYGLPKKNQFDTTRGRASRPEYDKEPGAGRRRDGHAQ
jgi:HD-like signal output (HDOD) protein